MKPFQTVQPVDPSPVLPEGRDMKAVPPPPNPFTLKVMAVVRAIPKGRVATYQQVAELAGRSHASRAVAWILNSCSKKYKLPWQRVVSSKGKIAFKPGTSYFMLQRRLLRSESVDVDLRSGAIDMKRFQLRKKARRQRNQPRLFE